MADIERLAERLTRWECPECGSHTGSGRSHTIDCTTMERVEVEYIRAAEYEGAVNALAELVRLKDGPRDDAYRAAKDAAWDAARAVVNHVRGQ
jgi:hypothetical protein